MKLEGWAQQNQQDTYQGSAAEQDHKNDEGFEPVVLHYDETSLPERPPALVVGAFLIDLAALKPTYAAWGKI